MYTPEAVLRSARVAETPCRSIVVVVKRSLLSGEGGCIGGRAAHLALLCPLREGMVTRVLGVEGPVAKGSQRHELPELGEFGGGGGAEGFPNHLVKRGSERGDPEHEERQQQAPRRGMGRVAPGLWLFGGALGWGHGARVPTPTEQFPASGPTIPPPAAVR
mgnify:FL=1